MGPLSFYINLLLWGLRLCVYIGLTTHSISTQVIVFIFRYINLSTSSTHCYFSSKHGNKIHLYGSSQTKASKNTFSKKWKLNQHRCSERPLCGLCWRNPQAVRHSLILLEPSFVSRLVKFSRRRVRVWSSYGWSNNSLQWRLLQESHSSTKLFFIKLWLHSNLYWVRLFFGSTIWWWSKP